MGVVDRDGLLYDLIITEDKSYRSISVEGVDKLKVVSEAVRKIGV